MLSLITFSKKLLSVSFLDLIKLIKQKRRYIETHKVILGKSLRKQSIPIYLHETIKKIRASKKGFLAGARVGPNNIDQCLISIVFAMSENRLLGILTYSKKVQGYGFISACSNKKIPLSNGGWHKIVDRIYFEQISNYKPTFAVGLFAYVDPKARKEGVAKRIITGFKSYTKDNNFDSLFIPLLLPSSSQESNVFKDIDNYAFLKREDGLFTDYWLRLHNRNFAEIVRTEKESHLYALSKEQLGSLSEYDDNVKTTILDKGSSILVTRKEKNYLFKLIPDANFYLCKVPCVWVKYNLLVNK